MFSRLLVVLLVLGVTMGAGQSAETAGSVTYSVEENFDDVVFDLENAVIDEGLTVDYHGNVNAMLERTSETVGATTDDGEKSPYLGAIYMHFCSATLSHEAMSADVGNLAICPYVVFAYEARATPGTVVVGYRRPIAGSSEATLAALAKIDALLDGIVRSAAGQ